MGAPVRLGNTGASGVELICLSQPRSSLAVFFHSGMTRCFAAFAVQVHGRLAVQQHVTHRPAATDPCGP